MNVTVRVLIPVLALAAGGSATALFGGCGSKAPDVGPSTVKGKVVLNGQPVVGGLVVFTPNPERGASGKSAFAETGADGSYALQLNQTNAIPPGWYRVSLAPAPVQTSGVFPAKLSRPDMSGIEREVKPGKEHVFEFVVDVPKE